jgi:hypothetical protein
MRTGRGGIGAHKHGVSGHPGRSPRYKFMQGLEAERKQDKKPKANMHCQTVAEAMADAGLGRKR